MQHRSPSRFPGRLVRRRRISAVAAVLSLASASLFVGLAITSTPASAAAASSAFNASETVSRVNLINGKNVVADTRHFSVSIDTTKDLRDRQGLDITWKGAHPTGGVVPNVNTPWASDQEYPVVILQCRGVGSTSAPVAQQLSQQTCFTENPLTRYQGPYKGAFPPYRLDRYATTSDRGLTVGAPKTIPSSCLQADGFDAQRWVPFKAVNATTYYGGYDGCDGLAPEQSIVGSDLSPSNQTFGTTNLDGSGSARFIVQDATDNASLGCSSSVACSLVVIPIEGVSCDATAAGLPAADRPAPTELAADQSECTTTGAYGAGAYNANPRGIDTITKIAVDGQLWWSASNWRNRVVVPITFAPTASSCSITASAAPTNIYGSEYLLQATQQWAPTFCSDAKLFPLQHTQTSEVQAKNLLASSVSNNQYLGAKAAFQAEPPEPTFQNPIVQAPTALTGFGIGYVMDDQSGNEYTSLRLDARLLAKLLTMSYPSLPAIRSDWAAGADKGEYQALGNNPIDLQADPEFLALNPGMKAKPGNITIYNQLFASATMFVTSADSDVMTALTSYINADPDARAWLNGKPDPWGMVVNPNYRKIALPVQAWPLLDNYYFSGTTNECIKDTDAPFLPLIAGQVSDPSQLTFNLQYGISSALANCTLSDPNGPDTAANRRLVPEGRQQPGQRFMLGLVSVADARRYGIRTAALETQRASDAPDRFSDATGRYFASADNASLDAAAKQLRPDDHLRSWVLPYSEMRTAAGARDAYPGTLLISTDVPTYGLTAFDASRYSRFLDYVAGPGQVSGELNGQLADGYVPITQADGLESLHDYTVAAAAAVLAQRGEIPTPTDPDPAPAPSSSSPATAASATSGAATRSPSSPKPATSAHVPPRSGAAPTPNGPTGQPIAQGEATEPGASVTPTTAGKTSSSASRSGSPAPVGSSSSSPVFSSPAAAVASFKTPDSPAGWSSHVLLALAIVALASGAVAALTSGIGRRA